MTSCLAWFGSVQVWWEAANDTVAWEAIMTQLDSSWHYLYLGVAQN